MHAARAQCSHCPEQREVSRSWGEAVGGRDHARPLLPPQAAQQPSLIPKLFSHTTTNVTVGKPPLPQMELPICIIQKSIQISILLQAQTIPDINF